MKGLSMVKTKRKLHPLQTIMILIILLILSILISINMGYIKISIIRYL